MGTAARQEVGLDELGGDAPVAPKLEDIKLDGITDLPEELKGKSAADLLEHTRRLKSALTISERAREDGRTQLSILASAGARSGGEGGAPPAPPVIEPVDKTPEELAVMMADPAQAASALRIMGEQTERRVRKDFEQRLAPMTESGASGAEQRARARHPDAFKYLEAEIKASAAKAPDKSILNNDSIWDDVVAHAVGKNYKKFEDSKSAEANTAREAAALQAAAEGTPFSGTGSTQRPPAPVGNKKLDQTQLDICKVMGISPEEYIKWNI